MSACDRPPCVRVLAARRDCRALALLAVLVTLLAGCARARGEQTDARIEEVYARQCALCHGGRGAADGPAAYLLFPPARDFTRGVFKLASTQNGAPSDHDLVATLRRGMPGSAMPAWSWMEEAELRALARYVRELAFEGVLEELRSEHGGEADLAALRAQARARVEPGPALEVAPPAPRSQEVLARGAHLYEQHCASCHGADGKGRPEELRRDEDQTLNWARDFTSGVVKGGVSAAELERRIRVGLHGTAMPAASLPAADMAALVAHVQSLFAVGSEDRLVQRRQVLRVRRAEGELPTRSDDRHWDEAAELDLALAPLWWRAGALVEASVAALHDGERIAFRVRWKDATADAPQDLQPPYDAPLYADAAAVQLSPLEHPPFFGMGDGAPRTDLWHWRSVDVPDASDLEPFLELIPHRLGEWLTGGGLRDVAWYRAARGPVHVGGEAAAVAPTGMRRLEAQHPLTAAPAAVASWWAGEWEVVFSRALDPGAGAGLALAPGGSASFGLALWNGSNRDLGGQKSLTIWHALELEP